MRAFRDSLISVWMSWALPALLALLTCAAAHADAAGASPSTGTASGAAAEQNPYFPLAVGNSWLYRCAVEGQFQFTKRVTITAAEAARRFRAETRISNDPKPLVTQFSIDAAGTVSASVAGKPEVLEPLIMAAPKVGDRLGAFTVAEVGLSEDKRYRKTEAVRLQTFSMDDPSVPEERRLEWRGRTYGRGIGLLEEADGLGGACVLSNHSLKASN